MSEEKAETPVIEFQKPDKLKGLNRGPKGNQFAVTHGFYSEQWTEQEKAEREAWRQSMLEEKGNPTFAERSLITTASWLNAIITRGFKSMEAGKGAPAHEHLLSIVNSFRLIMCALGLERKTKPSQNLQDYLANKAKSENQNG